MAGTGRSHTLCGFLPQSVMGMYFFNPFGESVYLIRGFILHSLFSIPVKAGSRPYVEINGESLKKIQDRFNKVHVLIID